MLLVTAGALVAVLALSGAMLTFRYRPDPLAGLGGNEAPSSLFTARNVHRLASWLLLVDLFVLAALVLMHSVAARRPWATLLPISVFAVTVFAMWTGQLLPWDQLALAEVTVGRDLRGYGKILFGDDVRSVLIDNIEISPGALSSWFWSHSVVIPLALVVGLAAMARLSGGDRYRVSRRGTAPPRGTRVPGGSPR